MCSPNHAELSLEGGVLREIEFQKTFATTTPSFLSADFAQPVASDTSNNAQRQPEHDGEFRILSWQIYSDEFHWSGIQLGKHILHL